MAIIKIRNAAIDLDAAEIPNLPATKITSGTLDNARISLDAAEIPNLDTAKITTGTLADARVPNLNASKITTGTLADARVPNLNASKITAGTIATARLGSGTANSSTFLRGDNTFAEAGGGGTALVHTSNITSATSNIVIDGIFSSTYKNYLIVGKARNASSDVQLELRYRQGGSTITTTNYRRTWNGNYGTTSSSVSDYGSATYGDDAITIINNMNSNTYSGAYFSIWLFDPLGTSNYKNVMFQSISESVNSPKSFMNLTGNGLFYANTTALTGLDFYCTSVNIAEANIKIYGLL